MANSNSAHSRQQRVKTSAEWKKSNIKQKVYMANINNKEDRENLNLLDSMDGRLIDKFRELFKIYRIYKI